VVVRFDDVDASNAPAPRGIRFGIHFPQNGEAADTDLSNSRQYHEGTTTCSGHTSSCDNAHTSVVLDPTETIIEHEDGAAADSLGPARTYGLLTRVFSPNPFTLRWDGSTYPGNGQQYSNALGHTDRVSVCAGSSCGSAAGKLETVTVHKVTSNTDTTIDATALNSTDSKWTGVQAEGKVAMFARDGQLLTRLDFTSSHAGAGQYLISGMKAGTYNVHVNGAVVVSGGVVNDGDNSLYFESPSGGISIQAAGAPQCSIGTTTLAAATARENYSQQLQTSDCIAPVAWSLSAGTLCSGLTVDAATGTIAGIPTQPQPCGFTLQVTDYAGYSASQDYAMTVVGRPGVALSRQFSCTGCKW
jgi:hypothetical protein